MAGPLFAPAARPHALPSAAPGFWRDFVSPAARAARDVAGSLAASGALLLCDAAAACTPAYRPSARSAVTPYVGHSFTFLRTLFDVRPQAVFSALNEGLRLVCIL